MIVIHNYEYGSDPVTKQSVLLSLSEDKKQCRYDFDVPRPYPSLPIVEAFTHNTGDLAASLGVEANLAGEFPYTWIACELLRRRMTEECSSETGIERHFREQEQSSAA